MTCLQAKASPGKTGPIRSGHIRHGRRLTLVSDGAEDMPIGRVGGVFDGDDLPWRQQDIEAGNVVGWREHPEHRLVGLAHQRRETFPAVIRVVVTHELATALLGMGVPGRMAPSGV